MGIIELLQTVIRVALDLMELNEKNKFLISVAVLATVVCYLSGQMLSEETRLTRVKYIRVFLKLVSFTTATIALYIGLHLIAPIYFTFYVFPAVYVTAFVVKFFDHIRDAFELLKKKHVHGKI